MPKLAKPFTISHRTDSKTFFLTLNYTCGLPKRLCDGWYRKSFYKFPEELANYRNPKTKAAAETGALALIEYLKKQRDDGTRVITDNITVGAWLEKFTAIETSPRTGINASINKPYSLNTLDSYKSYFKCHIKDDPLCKLIMAEVEEEDILEFVTRLSIKKYKGGKNARTEEIGGSRTFSSVISFMHMAFGEYKRKTRKWINPFQDMYAPKSNKKPRDALPEDEMLKLFQPGVLTETMDMAVCSAMFLSGLRRGEIYALRPDDLDWQTPKITVCRAWQRLGKKDRKLGPTKGKKERKAPFDPILQAAIKKLWEENGQHEFVFCHKNGKLIGTNWWKRHFSKWLKRAGIELGGRDIVPHSSRHSLASMLEEKGVSIRYIQELLGHSDLKTTKIYLHSTEKTIRDIGRKISETMEQKPEEKIIEFKVS